ncbi:hypothetical protein RFI_10145 [Reticulomyxa filosa]|uniref:Alanine dehydrogenase/pyridine nucleotide transhydrogenase N-terminal domain-containing protein n=1 Tax=Reticulomyxa filosa TaxID=46433 RepID=X6NL26_RETFI|nr:hypothetical protein RFI_10145 [Reticulomyxa filosa]|eukprot:ETO26985.1 hypothetical protein RFI_10145 [Reticulomyxa filosa]
MKPTNTLGILREVKSKWERRVAITPSQVQLLVSKGIRVLVQPCERRVFKDVEFKEAGAILTDDLSPANCIVGVKEFPAHKLIDDHSYMMFSHVIKAQPYNMPFLDTCLQKNIRLFDYECIRDPRNSKRLVAFGRFAGLAGMITGFRGLGEHLLAMGATTPFLYSASSYMYPSLKEAQQDLEYIAEMISKFGLPRKFGPFTFVFTGAGNVTQGALEIFKLLPHEFVKWEDLPALEKNFDNHKVYGCLLPTSALVEPLVKTGEPFSSKHYYQNPEQYRPVFHERIAPYTRILVNGMYWDHTFPRLLTCEQTAQVKVKYPNSLLSVFDITYDNYRCTFFYDDPLVNDISSNIGMLDKEKEERVKNLSHLLNKLVCCVVDGNGILVLGVDALPAELPREVRACFFLFYFILSLDSFQFRVLYPFLESLANSDGRLPFAEQTDFHWKFKTRALHVITNLQNHFNIFKP